MSELCVLLNSKPNTFETCQCFKYAFLHVYTLNGKIVALLLEACKEDIMLYCQEAFTVCHISARDVYRRVIIIS